MINIRLIATVLLIPFSLLTIYAVIEVGYWGIFDYHRYSPAGWQVFADLVVSLILVLCWLVRDAQQAGRNPWLWVVATFFAGSIAPLLYLIVFKGKEN